MASAMVQALCGFFQLFEPKSPLEPLYELERQSELQARDYALYVELQTLKAESIQPRDNVVILQRCSPLGRQAAEEAKLKAARVWREVDLPPVGEPTGTLVIFRWLTPAELEAAPEQKEQRLMSAERQIKDSRRRSLLKELLNSWRGSVTRKAYPVSRLKDLTQRVQRQKERWAFRSWRTSTDQRKAFLKRQAGKLRFLEGCRARTLCRAFFRHWRRAAFEAQRRGGSPSGFAGLGECFGLVTSPSSANRSSLELLARLELQTALKPSEYLTYVQLQLAKLDSIRWDEQIVMLQQRRTNLGRYVASHARLKAARPWRQVDLPPDTEPAGPLAIFRPLTCEELDVVPSNFERRLRATQKRIQVSAQQTCGKKIFHAWHSLVAAQAQRLRRLQDFRRRRLQELFFRSWRAGLVSWQQREAQRQALREAWLSTRCQAVRNRFLLAAALQWWSSIILQVRRLRRVKERTFRDVASAILWQWRKAILQDLAKRSRGARRPLPQSQRQTTLETREYRWIFELEVPVELYHEAVAAMGEQSNGLRDDAGLLLLSDDDAGAEGHEAMRGFLWSALRSRPAILEKISEAKHFTIRLTLGDGAASSSGYPPLTVLIEAHVEEEPEREAKTKRERRMQEEESAWTSLTQKRGQLMLEERRVCPNRNAFASLQSSDDEDDSGLGN